VEEKESGGNVKGKEIWSRKQEGQKKYQLGSFFKGPEEERGHIVIVSGRHRKRELQKKCKSPYYLCILHPCIQSTVN
jgi:hypothetical protein